MQDNKNLSPLVVIVEDDTEISRLSAMLLESEGFRCQTFDNGENAISFIEKETPALVILDVMLPGKSGVEVCTQLRSFFDGAIIMLTGCDDDITQLSSFKQGADDYIIKPIKPHLLLARIEALLSRTYQTKNSVKKEISFASLSINAETRNVFVNDVALDLSSAEFELLEFLSHNAGEIVTRDQCCEKLRGFAYDGMDRSIDMRISSLRKKLSQYPEHEKRIITVRGRGYMLVRE